MQRVTIHDVARLAGVSNATVSRVLTGTKPVSDDLSDRVREVAARLGYRPNPAAQVLLRGRSQTVGVVVPDLANAYFAEILKGATAAAAESGWQTLVADADEDAAQEYRSAMELARWVDGLMLCSPRMSTPLLNEVAAAVPSVVLVNRVVRHPPLASVVVDYRRGMALICDHLMALGHRRIAYLQGPPQAWTDRQRRRALESAAARGLDVAGVPCGSASSDGYRAAGDALERGVTAVVAFNDQVALGALARFTELGVRVPDDVSLVGFDDIAVGALVSPGLTTVGVDKPALGSLALARLESRSPAPPDKVASELVVRGSTAAPR